jgi:hypothetical protein
MSTSIAQFPSSESLKLLSRLLFEAGETASATSFGDDLQDTIASIGKPEFDDLLALAQLNHVVIRGFEVFSRYARAAGDQERMEWAEAALQDERSRIDNALPFLQEICTAFTQQGYGVAVIKSLDHWPDLGSDLDLFTSASSEEVCELMKQRFAADMEPRSWGDRLAGKWNFMIPGLPEAVEIHVRRLGQTGEQVEIASSVLARSRRIQVGGYDFRVPSVSERLMISTLQRMYRHFYFRLCDVVDSASLVENLAIDYKDLEAAATRAGIWKGVATYLQIVSDYVKSYRGRGLVLPHLVTESAQFGGGETYYARGFIRVPIMPQSARLYTSQLADVFSKGELHNGVRLSLLPWLATAAVVGQKLTGSDKGIW